VSGWLWLFVDGIGLAPEGEENPLSVEPMPALRRLLGGAPTLERVGRGDGWHFAAIDATLGVGGLPQSATGQTALFTGENAPEILGRHVPALPGPRLGEILKEKSVLRRAARAGRRVTFANPFSRRYFDEVEARRRRHSATTLAALAAGEPLRDLDDLAAGRACAWDVTRESFRSHAPGTEPIAAEEAGRHLAALAGQHDLTIWETFMTDLAGHHRFGWTAAEALARLDGLLAGLLPALPPDVTLVLTSDHGNLEEAGHRRHTRNPVPLLAVGPHAGALEGVDRIDRLAPRVLELLGVGPASTGESTSPAGEPVAL